MKPRYLTGPRVLAIIILAVLAAAVAFAIRTPPAPVDTAEVRRGPMTVTIDDLGETRVTDLYVVSAPITGELLRVPLKAGAEVVARATLIARIQPAEPSALDARSFAQTVASISAIEAQLAAAKARVLEVQAEHALAQREFERSSELHRRGFASQAALERVRATRDRMSAAVAEAQRSVQATAHNLEAARATLVLPGSPARGRGTVSVTSPVNGYVLRVPQESERVVVAGTALVEIGDPTRLEIVTDLLSSDAVQVKPGDAVLIESWGGERPLRGRVRLVEPYGFTKFSALGVEEQRVNVIIDLADPRQAWQRLGHGYRAVIRIVTWSSPDALQVPISALFRDGREWAVFAVRSNRAILTPVRIGRMNDETAEIRSGLSAGDRVILHPSDKVSDGARVRWSG